MLIINTLSHITLTISHSISTLCTLSHAIERRERKKNRTRRRDRETPTPTREDGQTMSQGDETWCDFEELQ